MNKCNQNRVAYLKWKYIQRHFHDRAHNKARKGGIVFSTTKQQILVCKLGDTTKKNNQYLYENRRKPVIDIYFVFIVVVGPTKRNQSQNVYKIG